MIQGIQAQKIQFPGQKPGIDQKPPVTEKKEPDVGSLLAGKKPDKIKTTQDSIQNRLANIDKIGADNKKPLDLMA